MDNIFIDTSIIMGGNYFESTKLKEILKLATEGHLQILTPEITYREIEKHAIADINKAIKEQKKYREESRILRNVPSVKDDFKLYKKPEIKKEFFDDLNKKLTDAKYIRVPYPTSGIDDIFKKYFANEAPFDGEAKKHEFPDAFALRSMEEWCERNGQKCIVLSKDSDMINYKSNSLVHRELSEYVDTKLREVSEIRFLKLADTVYKSESLDIEDQIKSWVKEQVDDYSAFDEYFNYYEVHDIQIKKLKVELLGYKFTSVTKDSVTFHSEAKIILHVEVEVDDENNGYYDSEEKEWIALDTRRETIEDTFIIPVEIKAVKPEAGEEYMEIEVYEINNNRALDFRDDSHL